MRRNDRGVLLQCKKAYSGDGLRNTEQVGPKTGASSVNQ